MSLDRLDARFPDKRAVITGGASGLGLAAAELLAARGWKLALLDLDASRLQEAAASLVQRGSPRCATYAVDIRQQPAVQSAIDNFSGACGGLDLALNSAGVAVAGGFLETPPADWDWIMQINVHGVAHSCRAELPHMLTGGGGLIINVASAASFASGGEMSSYNASKSAVVALSETLFIEFGNRGVHVASAMPGFFRTRLMEHARAPSSARNFAVRMMERSKVTAEEVALEILSRAATGDVHIVLPGHYRWLWRFKRLAPFTFIRWMRSLREKAITAARAKGR